VTVYSKLNESCFNSSTKGNRFKFAFPSIQPLHSFSIHDPVNITLPYQYTSVSSRPENDWHAAAEQDANTVTLLHVKRRHPKISILRSHKNAKIELVKLSP
jgi:hypothetical protein